VGINYPPSSQLEETVKRVMVATCKNYIRAQENFDSTNLLRKNVKRHTILAVIIKIK